MNEKGKNKIMKISLKSKTHGKHKISIKYISNHNVHGLNSLIEKEILVN